MALLLITTPAQLAAARVRLGLPTTLGGLGCRFSLTLRCCQQLCSGVYALAALHVPVLCSENVL